MELAAEAKTDMSKMTVSASCHEPSLIPLTKTLIIAEHEEPWVLDAPANSINLRSLFPLWRKRVLM